MLSLIQSDSFHFWLISGVLLATSGGLFLATFRKLMRSRLMQDIPTSRIRSAPQGYVELEGISKIMDGPAIICPLSAARCAWWRYKIEKHRSNGRNSRWSTVESDCSDDLFLLDDGTGQCIIDPEGAQVIPTRKRTWYGHTERPSRGPAAGSNLFSSGNYRYTEELIDLGAHLYAIGEFRSQRGRFSLSRNERIQELIAEWKDDQAGLLKRFDLNKDGHLDSREWEAARRVARMQIDREAPVETGPADKLHILGQSPNRPFLLSGVEQHELAKRFKWQSVLSFLGFLLTGSMFIWIIILRWSA